MVSGNVRRGWTIIILLGLWFEAGTLGCVGAVAGDKSAETQAPAPRNSFAVYLGSRVIHADLSNRIDLLRLNKALESEPDWRGKEDPSADLPGVGKRAHRGLREMHRLIAAILDCNDPREAQKLRTLLLESAAASGNLSHQPLPERVDFVEMPWLFMNRLSRPVGKGKTDATNLQAGHEDDLSQVDPEPSTFWQRPATISGKDLFYGFGRGHLLLESYPLCSYSGPKESFGRNPGFEIESNGKKLKLKFAEVSSEPFAARIFDALGYHADPTDYAASVKVGYSRRLLQEFNSRKPLRTQFTLFGFLPLFTLQLQQDYDPFQYVAAAILTDGTSLSGPELKRRLFYRLDAPHPELDPTNFRTEFESRIEYLTTVPANVQIKTGKSIGPWDFGELDHASRRELRGVGLLAAWLGWFDTRSDNTRLRIIDKDRNELAHYFSDLGGVLGETSGILFSRGEQPNAFPWTFTRPALWQGPHHLARPLRLTGYKPVDLTPAFAEMTLDDARWMARLIAALRPEQIEQALIASGYDSAQVRLYLAKLLSRRDRMLRDLGLINQLPLSAASVNPHFSYDPLRDGTLRVRVAGTLVQAPLGTHRIVDGKLLGRKRTQAAQRENSTSPPMALSF